MLTPVLIPKLGSAARKKYLDIKHKARKKNIPFDMSEQLFLELASQPCFYCGLPPSAVRKTKTDYFVHTSIDRLDSNLGYYDTNIVPCCWPCNRAKGNWRLPEFMKWIARLNEHMNGIFSHYTDEGLA